MLHEQGPLVKLSFPPNPASSGVSAQALEPEPLDVKPSRASILSTGPSKGSMHNTYVVVVIIVTASRGAFVKDANFQPQT